MRGLLQSSAKWFGTAVGLASGSYAAYVLTTWFRYGNPPRPSRGDDDPSLDRFMPRYDVVERHRVNVNAPAAVTLAVAKDLDLSQLPVVRAIFKAREWILRSTPDQRSRPRGIVDETRALGWVVLDDVAGREIVMGAVTKPWAANVVFRSIEPDAFAAFSEPGYVKIAWTLRADPRGDDFSTFRTETRAVATDLEATRRFRLYWSFLSPGISLIRWLSLAPVKREAELRARSSARNELVHQS
jgi:hypothetical protein